MEDLNCGIFPGNYYDDEWELTVSEEPEQTQEDKEPQ